MAQTWLQERLKIRLRERLTHVLLDLWLKPNRAYQLGFVGENGPSLTSACRRIAACSPSSRRNSASACCRRFSSSSASSACSGPCPVHVSFTLPDDDITIPGYMVWVAVGYAGLGSGLTWLVGRPLIRPQHRALCARGRTALRAGARERERRERRPLQWRARRAPEPRRVRRGGPQGATRRLSGGLARLTWITSGYGWLAIVVPILAAAPGYFSGALSFGGMMMVVGAFNQVQAALRYFVDNFPKIADWRSAVLRVATFRQARHRSRRSRRPKTGSIEIVPIRKGWLSFEDLSIAMSDGSVLIEDATAEIRPGERVLIMGESGVGQEHAVSRHRGPVALGLRPIRIPCPRR